MRQFFFAVVAFFLTTNAQSQGLGINSDNASPHPSAMLDVSSSNKGVLIPRMATSLRLAIQSPATGLLVYDTDLNSLFIYTNGWKAVKAISSLSELIQGANPGDILKWNGTQWEVVPLGSLIQYYYRDKDGDGYGDKFQPIAGTTALAGFVSDNTDCDDDDANVHPGAVDNPGDGIDNDCDGVDGSISNIIFVSASLGSNGNSGTKVSPLATIASGIAKAIAENKTQVYIAQGTYNERVILSNGISLYGGYSGTNWIPTGTGSVITGSSSGGRTSGIEGFSITSQTILEGLTIETIDAVVAGTSNYGIYCVSCPGVKLNNSTIIAGNGAAGQAGSNGVSPAQTAAKGGDGGNGSCDDLVTVAGGTPGASDCNRPGGVGGAGGKADQSGGTGGAGTNGLPLGGVGGDAGNAFLGQNGEAGAQGQPGDNGQHGTNGSGGQGGIIISNLWLGTAGANGTSGTNGGGGSGGGGGGGEYGPLVNEGTGNGGGAGGSGGCGGTAGLGGTAGGGSFALFLVSSSNLSIAGNTLQSGKGGDGGKGGNGSNGQSGGAGGLGGNTCTNDVGAGGNGGKGGNGGNGGAGGGGAGGVSYSVYKVNTVLQTNGNTLTPGPGGIGGQGGTAPLSQAQSGAPGASGQSN